jgi:DNA primase large subunit
MQERGGRDIDFAVRYPFSDSAKAAIEGIAINDRILDLATNRIMKAIRNDTSGRMLIHETDKKEDIASFAVARMILGHLRNNYITNTFAVNESKTMSNYLNREDEETLIAVSDIFGIKPSQKDGQKDKDAFVLDLPTYLRFCPKSPAYRLINRRLVQGMVEISRGEWKRLVEEAAKKRMERIPLVKEPAEEIKAAAKKVLDSLPKTDNTKLEALKVEDHPPCIAKLLESLSRHENLPHQARWYLTTYFLGLNTSEDDIVKLFVGAPDYSEKITRYQVAHIKKKGYSIPSCATVLGYGLCVADCRISTPMNWHRLSRQRKEEIRK